MEPGDELAPGQRAAVEARARGASLADAARKAGASIRTLFAWRPREPFQDALRQAQDSLFENARGELRAATADAVRTLREIVTDRDASASARVRAASWRTSNRDAGR